MTYMQNSDYTYSQTRIAVIGGGAAGMMAAGTAARNGDYRKTGLSGSWLCTEGGVTGVW